MSEHRHAQATAHRSAPKIAVIAKHLADRSGGAERVCCDQVNLLAERGYEVSCVTYDRPGQKPFFPLDPRIELIHLGGAAPDFATTAMTLAYKAMPKALHARDKLRWWTRNRDFIAQLERYFDGARPDLAITYLPTANTPALIAAAGRPVRVIVTNHNVPKEDYQNPRRWGGGEYDRALRLRALDRADRIHVLFPSFGAWFPEHLQDRIVAIPNHVPADPGNHLETPEQRDQTILAVGRLAAVKNFLYLVEAWARLGHARGDWQVKVFGAAGPEEKKLRRRISELHLDDSFHLMGTTDQITHEYRKAAIMCHPAEFEGFGLAPAEALACGTPVVAYTDTPGLQEFLQDGRNALLADRAGDRVDHLANALLTLMQDEPLRHHLGEAGPESVAWFSRETYVDRWLQLIDSVLEDDVSVPYRIFT